MKKTIVTSALPYINGVKHLGNLIGSLLPADIYARFLRQKQEDVIFICGTDEHGAPAEISAETTGIPVQAYCDEMYQVQKEIYEKFDLSFDYFGRSSAPENHAVTQDIFKRLYNAGYISQGSALQLYDEVGQRFLPDRFVEGTCPHCGFERARGDQCDNCTKLLDAAELINPRSAVTGSTALVLRESHQLYLSLSLFQERLADWLSTKEGYWPTTSLSIAKKWLREGLKDRAITRDLKWGISVPLPGFEDKVFYVWFDAPNGYISMTKEWAQAQGTPDLWEVYWKDPDTRLVQFMAKDNVPFHTIIWPAMLMGADVGYNLADFIKGFEYLNYESGKFSTSEKRGVFTDTALAEFPADYWRYYLVTIAPERADSDFTWHGFKKTIDDLADTLGNFVHRTLTFINRYYDGALFDSQSDRDADTQMRGRVRELADQCDRDLSKCNFVAWARNLREIWSEGNRYFNTQAPWVIRKTSAEEAGLTLFNSARLCYTIAVLSSPLIPSLARQIFRQLNLNGDPAHLPWDAAFIERPFPQGHRISAELSPLCQKISDELITEMERKYGGV
jgi:methionyl-tRNA synthetase